MPDPLTSRSHPIEVHRVPSRDLPLQGSIGFTLAPGRKGPGQAGHHDRDLNADMDRLQRDYGTNVLVSLVPEKEAAARTGVSVEDERSAAERRGMTFHHLPVEVGELPERGELVDLVQMLRDQLELGRHVVVHDRAGGGRSATVVTALLIAQGHDVDAAVQAVRNVRPKAVEPAQAKELAAVAERLAHRASPLLAVVINAFEQRGWIYERAAGTTILKSGFTHDGVQVPFFIKTAERYEQVHAFGRVAAQSPEPTRAAVAELLHRINWNIVLGCFELDYTDGEVRFRNSIDVEGGELAPKMVVTTVGTTFMTAARFAPAIQAVAQGGVRPEEAIAHMAASAS